MGVLFFSSVSFFLGLDSGWVYVFSGFWRLELKHLDPFLLMDEFSGCYFVWFMGLNRFHVWGRKNRSSYWCWIWWICLQFQLLLGSLITHIEVIINAHLISFLLQNCILKNYSHCWRTIFSFCDLVSGFETVTYMLDGAFTHQDFAGHKGTIRTGDVQVLVLDM